MSFSTTKSYTVPAVAAGDLSYPTTGAALKPHLIEQINMTHEAILDCGMLALTSSDVPLINDVVPTTINTTLPRDVCIKGYKHPTANYYVFIKFCLNSLAVSNNVAATNIIYFNNYFDLICAYHVSETMAVSDNDFIYPTTKTGVVNSISDYLSGLRNIYAFMNDETFWLTTSPYCKLNSNSVGAAAGTLGFAYSGYMSFNTLYVEKKLDSLRCYFGLYKQININGRFEFNRFTDVISVTPNGRKLTSNENTLLNMEVPVNNDYAIPLFFVIKNGIYYNKSTDRFNLFDLDLKSVSKLKYSDSGVYNDTNLYYTKLGSVDDNTVYTIEGKKYICMKAFGSFKVEFSKFFIRLNSAQNDNQSESKILLLPIE